MNESARRCVFCTASETWQIGLRTLVWKSTLNSYNIYWFWICLRLINVWEHIKKLAENIYVNRAEIIRKVTMTLLLVNSNKDFDWVRTPCLFYFRSVKFHYVKETHMMLVAFWWTLVKIVLVSQHRRQRNKSFHDLKTPTRTWKCTRCIMQMNYSYTSDLPFKSFCKLAKRADTIRNYQKQVLVMIKHCLANLKQ